MEQARVDRPVPPATLDADLPRLRRHDGYLTFASRRSRRFVGPDGRGVFLLVPVAGQIPGFAVAGRGKREQQRGSYGGGNFHVILSQQ